MDEFPTDDLWACRGMLDGLPHRERLCGFISGKWEILCWEPADLFQFYYDTKPILGSLDGLLPLLDGAAVERAIRTGLCNLYHGCVHNMLYEKSEKILRGLYKSAVFTVQAMTFLQTGKYTCRQGDLLPVLSPGGRAIVETALYLRQGGTVDFVPMSEALFAWTSFCMG